MSSYYKHLQIKGDTSIRKFLFKQERQESLFDRKADRLIEICEILLCDRDAFHIKVHWSSDQLTVWNYTTPYEYNVYVGEEVFSKDLIELSPKSTNWIESKITRNQIRHILKTHARLRFSDKNIYVRAGGINIINGMISMTFSCDGSHYIPFDQFDAVMENTFEIREVE